MTYIFRFTILILMTTAISCQSQKPASQGPQPTNDPTVYRGVTDANCAVEMAFGSYGSGIDGPSVEKVLALIEKYKLEYTSKPVGREGETRFCLPLKGVKQKKRKLIISQLKKIAKEGQLVSVSVR